MKKKYLHLKQRSRLTMIFIMVSAIVLYLLSQMMISEATGFLLSGVEKTNTINYKILARHYRQRIITLVNAVENHIANTNPSGMINEINQVISDNSFIQELSIIYKNKVIFQHIESPNHNLTQSILASSSFELSDSHNVITIIQPLFDGANKWGDLVVFASTNEINTASNECQSEINQSISLFRKNCIYVIVTMLLAISIIFYLHARELSNPLVKLTKAIKSYNFNQLTPKLESEIKLTAGDEVAYLGQEFISMTRRLRDAYDNVSSSNKNLEAQVEQRTQELQLQNHTLELTNSNLQKEINYRIELEEDLKQSKIVAEEANNAKSSFLANISHEARTPINGILGSVELLQQTSLNFRQERLAENIKSSSKALLLTINDLLDASRIEMGKLPIYLEKCDISEIISETIDTVSSQIYKKNLHFSIISSANIPVYIKADKTRILQVLINLLNNATKFTNEGHIRLQVRYFSLNNQDFIEFIVSDTG
ncbi:MAG: histidine kinase dimerization/phospho-acceptor domain-containing protein, partial [Lentisphaeria bacterium]